MPDRAPRPSREPPRYELGRPERGFFTGFLAIMAPIYAVLAVSWWTEPTRSRLAGIDWVAGWMTTEVIAALWTAAAVACLAGAIAGIMSRGRASTAKITTGLVCIGVPLLVSGYFFGATIVALTSHAGTPRGWVTGTSYLSWAAISAWALSVHTGLAYHVWERVTTRRRERADE